MKVLHVQVEYDDGWLIAQGLEDRAVITQGRTLDEIVQHVREVVDLLQGESGVQIELIVPPSVLAAKARGASRPVKAGNPRRPRTASNA